MPKDNENIRLPILGPIEPSEPQGFTPDQMIRCEACLRANPPTRISCLYCSAPMPVTESSAKLRRPILRPPEKHELGYNTILLPRAGAEAHDEAATLLKLKLDDLQRIISEGVPLPLARTASREEAEIVLERLRGLGLSVVNLSDEELGTTVKRVRSIGADDARVMINQDRGQDEVEVAWSNLKLIVPGRLVMKRVEVKELKSRRAEGEIMDTSEFFSDEAVIDLYSSTQAETWRIGAHSFDFSCLGAGKTLVANENIGRLQQWLLSRAPHAKLDVSYNRLRPLLDFVWSAEQETQSSGWRRERPGRLSIGMATIKSNETQFTRYSRLLYYLTSHG